MRSKRRSPNCQTSDSPPNTKKKKDSKEEDNNDDEEGVDVLPIVGGVLIATALGAPVIFVAGLKLGMFAAIGGGAMGYTTGKMFSDHG